MVYLLKKSEKEVLDDIIEDLQGHIEQYQRNIVSIQGDIVDSSIELRRYIKDYFERYY